MSACAAQTETPWLLQGYVSPRSSDYCVLLCPVYAYSDVRTAIAGYHRSALTTARMSPNHTVHSTRRCRAAASATHRVRHYEKTADLQNADRRFESGRHSPRRKRRTLGIRLWDEGRFVCWVVCNGSYGGLDLGLDAPQTVRRHSIHVAKTVQRDLRALDH
jgi:hypothetical protein